MRAWGGQTLRNPPPASPQAHRPCVPPPPHTHSGTPACTHHAPTALQAPALPERKQPAQLWLLRQQPDLATSCCQPPAPSRFACPPPTAAVSRVWWLGAGRVATLPPALDAAPELDGHHHQSAKRLALCTLRASVGCTRPERGAGPVPLCKAALQGSGARGCVRLQAACGARLGRRHCQAYTSGDQAWGPKPRQRVRATPHLAAATMPSLASANAPHSAPSCRRSLVPCARRCSIAAHLLTSSMRTAGGMLIWNM